MIINHNLNAMNAHRQMGINLGNTAKATEKLSSGLRINRAGDDAAGLAISEKMRGQIRGLNQASRNAQDGISLIQTAEGGLNETHAILQRMRELAVQSATDTNVEIDRGAIQDEMNQLVSEIDRISNTTEFNTQKLLNGGFKGTFQIGANEGQTVELQIAKMDTASLGLTSTNSMESKELTDGSNLKDGIYTVSEDGKNLLDVEGNTVGTLDTNKLTVNTKVTEFETAKLAKGAILTVKDGVADVKNTMTGEALKLAPGNYEVKGTDLIKDGQLVGTVADQTSVTVGGVTASEAELGFVATKLTTGAKFTINGSDVSTKATASGSITTINKAIETVSAERSKLGAMQNRLEHTIANLDTSSENLQASESRVRDVDMAKEMMNFSKNNILQQAAQAMLAQANNAPQGVLQLLR
ncbi:flagellin [Coprococcus sp. MSK.21.13]|nr:flagellin [Coprococcus sp. MSK.21.13]